MTDLINVLATLTDEQRAAIADLLDAERKHMVGFWTVLNEMRCRREMPEWATKLGDGSHASMERARKSQQQVNTALFGKQELWDYATEGVWISRCNQLTATRPGAGAAKEQQ